MASTEEDVQSPVSHAGPLVGSNSPVLMESLDISSLTEEQAGFITSVRLFEVGIRQKSLSSAESLPICSLRLLYSLLAFFSFPQSFGMFGTS